MDEVRPCPWGLVSSRDEDENECYYKWSFHGDRRSDEGSQTNGGRSTEKYRRQETCGGCRRGIGVSVDCRREQTVDERVEKRESRRGGSTSAVEAKERRVTQNWGEPGPETHTVRRSPWEGLQ